jgi:hypothetical protein
LNLLSEKLAAFSVLGVAFSHHPLPNANLATLRECNTPRKVIGFALIRFRTVTL